MNAAIFSSAPRWWQWRARLRQWWQGRLTAADAVLLTQRNVYILPTRAGLMLALTLGVLLIASINYQLNLGYLFTFLLAGCAAKISLEMLATAWKSTAIHTLRPAFA